MFHLGLGLVLNCTNVHYFYNKKARQQRWIKIWYFENALLATPHSSLALTFHRHKTLFLKADHTTDTTLHTSLQINSLQGYCDD